MKTLCTKRLITDQNTKTIRQGDLKVKVEGGTTIVFWCIEGKIDNLGSRRRNSLT